MPSSQCNPWMCRRIILNITCSNTISLTPMSLTHIILHHESNGLFLIFLENYKLDQNLELSFDSFKLTFYCMLNLSASDFFFGWFSNTFEIVYTHITLQMDSHNCFTFAIILLKVTFHVKLHISLG